MNKKKAKEELGKRMNDNLRKNNKLLRKEANRCEQTRISPNNLGGLMHMLLAQIILLQWIL